MKKTAMTAAKLAIGVAIILYLIYFVGIAEIYKTIKSANLLYLPLIVVVFVFSVAMRGLIFKVLLQPHETREKKFGLLKLAWISVLSWSAGMFTPGKLGEFSSIYLLKKEGVELGTAAAVSLFNKLLTAATVGLISIFGLLNFLGIKSVLQSVEIALIIVILSFVPYLIFATKLGRIFVKWFIKFLFPMELDKYENQFRGFGIEFTNYLIKRKKILFYSLVLNLAWIAISSWLFQLAFAAVGQRVGFVDVMLVNSIGTTTSFIPVTIGGTGLREASALIFFGKLGISNAAILGSHLIIAAISYTLAGLTALLFLARKNQ